MAQPWPCEMGPEVESQLAITNRQTGDTLGLCVPHLATFAVTVCGPEAIQAALEAYGSTELPPDDEQDDTDPGDPPWGDQGGADGERDDTAPIVDGAGASAPKSDPADTKASANGRKEAARSKATATND